MTLSDSDMLLAVQSHSRFYVQSTSQIALSKQASFCFDSNPSSDHALWYSQRIARSDWSIISYQLGLIEYMSLTCSFPACRSNSDVASQTAEIVSYRVLQSSMLRREQPHTDQERRPGVLVRICCFDFKVSEPQHS